MRCIAEDGDVLEIARRVDGTSMSIRDRQRHDAKIHIGGKLLDPRNCPGPGEMRHRLFQQEWIASLKKSPRIVSLRVAFLKEGKHFYSPFIVHSHNPVIEECLTIGCGDVEGIKIEQALPPNRSDVAFTHPDVDFSIPIDVARNFSCNLKIFTVGTRSAGDAGFTKEPLVIKHHHRVGLPWKLVKMTVSILERLQEIDWRAGGCD